MQIKKFKQFEHVNSITCSNIFRRIYLRKIGVTTNISSITCLNMSMHINMIKPFVNVHSVMYSNPLDILVNNISNVN